MSENELHKTLAFLSADPIGRGAALLIGIIACAFTYENFLIAQKDVQLTSKDELIGVKDERLKQLNDNIAGLKVELDYKPLKEKRLLDELTEKNETLKMQNAALSEIEKSVKSNGNDKLTTADLITEVKKLKETNAEIRRKLATYEFSTLVPNLDIRKGDSWEGFGGRVLLGLKDVSVSGFAKVNFTYDGASEPKEIGPGDQFKFFVNDQRYVLNILSVVYVGSKITISVSKV